MLSKDEELRVAACISIAKEDVRKKGAELVPETYLWLAEKLKEVNDELKEENKKVKGLRREISITDDEFNKLASRVEYCEKNHLN